MSDTRKKNGNTSAPGAKKPNPGSGAKKPHSTAQSAAKGTSGAKMPQSTAHSTAQSTSGAKKPQSKAQSAAHSTAQSAARTTSGARKPLSTAHSTAHSTAQSAVRSTSGTKVHSPAKKRGSGGILTKATPLERLTALAKRNGTKRKISRGTTAKVMGGDLQTMRKRIRILGIVMVCLFAVLCCRLAWYQLINSQKWRHLATEQQLSDTVLPAKRGTIYDAGGEVLVKSTTAWEITIDGKNIDEGHYDMLVNQLCHTLDQDPEYISERVKLAMTNSSKKAKINAKADKDQKEELQNFMDENEAPYLVFSTNTRRSYTHGSLGSTVLGFIGVENYGMTGLEARYNSELSGENGRIVTAKNAQGAELSDQYNTIVDAKEGNNLVLTIDATLQASVEKYLKQAVIENDIQNRACAIMMQVKTGAVLAMATMPDYDPADYMTVADKETSDYIKTLQGDEKTDALDAAQKAQWRNKCICDTYEPGSVFKPITMSAALEEGVTTVNDSFYCPGYKMIGKERVNCHKGSGHGSESLMKGMMNSCNPVFMTLGERLGGSGFFKYYKAFGFTERTGIDLPSEASTQANVHYHSEESLNKHPRDLAVSSFGQTNVVSPIQMITAISAVCNGGYLVEPYVVSSIVDESGNVVYTHDTVVKRQVISAETSRIVNSMLEATVSSGTAKNGYIAGYRIGGKTGTSEKIAEHAQTGERTYVASFCAIAPSDDPEIALLVLLDNPQGDSHMGGTIAAPVARNIMKEALPHLGVETIYTTDDIAALDTITPNVRGKSVEEAKDILAEKGLKVRVEGEGEIVTGQIPQSGQSIPKGGRVVVTTEDAGAVSMVIVPDVKGLSPSEANDRIANSGLNLRISGSGYDSSQGVVVSQSIPAESTVERGTVITLEFIVSGATD